MKLSRHCLFVLPGGRAWSNHTSICFLFCCQIEAGDVHVFFEVAEHPEVQRKGDNLLVEKKITLREALCGVNFNHTHLDGRRIVVRTARGQVVAPGALLCVRSEGMPRAANAYINGDLVFRFTIVFPGTHPFLCVLNVCCLVGLSVCLFFVIVLSC